MIQFNNLNQHTPYQLLKKKYDKAIKAGQKNIEAISISSYNTNKHEIDSRYVNLKFIIDEEFIFFSNYKSPKALAFNSHNQIAALVYWPSINIQIRIKADIKKTSTEFNNKYFFDRSLEKNALAISSNQSNPINSYSQVKENFKQSLNNDNLKKCPEYWGGFSFTPYSFEFWEGHENRLNFRQKFVIDDKKIWNSIILEP